MTANNKSPLVCPVTTKFTTQSFKRLQKVSSNPKKYFGMGSVPIAEIVRVAVDEKLDALEAEANQKVAISS